MNQRSNFAFLNREDFFKHPVCEQLYKYAAESERYFKNNEDLCAINARRFIEQFIRFVSFDLKDAKYPEKCRNIGSFFCTANEKEFYRIFGGTNTELIKQLNKATIPYFHPAEKKKDNLYKVIVINIYNLSWWLYQQLYPKDAKNKPDFREDYLPEDPGILEMEPAKVPDNVKYDRIKAYFPDCETDKLFQVEFQNGHYVIKDLKGKQVYTATDTEDYNYALEFAAQYKADYDALQADKKRMAIEFDQKQSKMIDEIERTKDELAEQKQNTLLLEDKLSAANNTISNMQSALDDSNGMAADMQEMLDAKEQELIEAKRESRDEYNQLKDRDKEIIKHFDERFNSLEMKLAQIAEENVYYRKKLESLDKTEEVKDFLLVINESIAGVNKGYSIYAGNKNEQELRSWLYKVKKYYEDQLEELREALRDRDNKLKFWEEKAIREASDYRSFEEPARPVIATKKKSGSRKAELPFILLAASAAVLTLLLGIYIINKLHPVDEQEQPDDTDTFIAEAIDEKEYASEHDNKLFRNDKNANEEIEESTTEPDMQLNDFDNDTATEEENADTADEVADIEDKSANNVEEAAVTEDKTANTAIPDVNELYSNIHKYYDAPESISLIPGVNPAIVRDIQLIDRRYFHNMDVSEETVKKNQDIMEFIGEYGMPFVYSPVGKPRDLSATCGSYSNLIRFKNAEVFKFVYSGGTFDTEDYGDYNACILPDELCEGIDENSTLDDFIKLLGSDPKSVYMRASKTDMSTADNEKGYLFKMKNLDAVMVFFDDNGKLCDYIYLFIAEGGGRTELVKPQE